MKQKIIPKPWSERSNTIGFIPGKKENRREALLDILRQLPLGHDQNLTVTMASGSRVLKSADEICGRQFSATGLTERRNDCWVPTEPTLKWMDSSNDLELAGHIHRNVKLFGELLPKIHGVESKDQLLEIPRLFGLPWSSSDQLYRRISWMRLFGFVEKWGHKHVVTAEGQAFLETIELATEEEAAGTNEAYDESEIELPPIGEYTSFAQGDQSPSTLKNRKALIGYIPRGVKSTSPIRSTSRGSHSPLDAIRNLIEIVGEGVTVDEFHDKCSERFGLKRASLTQTIHTLRHMKAIDMVSFDRYGVTPETVDLFELGNEIDLIRFLHTRYRFFGEILLYLSDPTPAPELSRIAGNLYGCTQIDNSEIRTRLGFMVDAGVVERIDWTRYRRTQLGHLLVDELPLEPSVKEDEPDTDDPEPSGAHSTTEIEAVFASIKDYSVRSDASDDFEAAVAQAFKFFGFQTQHLGGPGRTDVIAEACLPSDSRYRVIIDTKSSSSGIINDGNINFDALKDHKRKHRADFVMVIGPGFSERVREWAVNNEFTLLTCDDLINLLSWHAKFPLTLSELRMLFNEAGDDLVDLEEQYQACQRSSDLLVKLVELLYVEANEDEPLGGGYISLENIHYVIRKEMAPRPTTNAVEEALQFLSHDLVRGATQSGSKFKIADSPTNIMRRLAGLGSPMGQIYLPNK